MPADGFETIVAASERQPTHALDRAAIGIGNDATESRQIDSVVTRHIKQNRF
jgi:hypothetical protein